MNVVVANSYLDDLNLGTKWLIPYKPFARQDRYTDLGHCCETHLVDRLTPRNFTFLDLHSVCEDHEDDYKEIGQGEITRAILRKFGKLTDVKARVLPDHGSRDKFLTSDSFAENVFCSKSRDAETGKLLWFSIDSEVPQDMPLYIVDDICDGGGTFIGLAIELRKKMRSDQELNLMVTHGMFTKGIEPLLEHFDHIYTTDSYRTDLVETERLHVLNIKELL